MIDNCLFCGNKNPKEEMKTCCRKCADELKKINSREERFCLFCGKGFKIRKKDERKLCSEECRKQWQKLPDNIQNRIVLSKNAVKKKFGVDNIFQLEKTKEKARETKREKYGNENYNNPDKMIETKKEKYGEEYFKESMNNIKNIMMNNYGVDHPLKLTKFINKQKSTNLKKYGVENVSQNEKIKERRTETIKEKFGVENASQNEEIKEKKRQTSIKNFGVSHHLKDYDMFEKHLKVQYKVKQYKETNINYQGSYELLFLQKMDEKGLIDKVTNGKTYEYVFDEITHSYHTDFFYNEENIEIKSGWTYNNNGKNKRLEEINKAKFRSVIESGDKLKVLFSKQEINFFVENIIT